MYTAVSVNGTYGLTVTDANGCVWTAEITVTIADPCDSFVVTFLPPVDTTGMMLLFVDIDFGTPPFTYQWQDGSTNNPPFEATVIPGTYSVTVTDVNYCTAEDSIDLQ